MDPEEVDGDGEGIMGQFSDSDLLFCLSSSLFVVFASFLSPDDCFFNSSLEGEHILLLAVIRMVGIIIIDEIYLLSLKFCANYILLNSFIPYVIHNVNTILQNLVQSCD